MVKRTIKKGKGVIRRIRKDPKYLRKPYKVGSIEGTRGEVVPFITMMDVRTGDKVSYEKTADGMAKNIKILS